MDMIFEQLSDLYDADDYPALIGTCNSIIRRTADPLDLHIAYSFKALGQLYSDSHQYAVRNADKARQLCPTCPWAQWVQAFAYETRALGKQSDALTDQAIRLARDMIQRGEESMASDPCMEDVPSSAVQSYIIDCWFFLAHLHTHQGNINDASEAVRMFHLLTARGYETTFEVSDLPATSTP